jgi:histone-lysine N-methyltransferase SETMAR
MVSAISFFQQCVIHGHDFLERFVTGDGTWVNHHSPETKRASMEYKHPGFPRSKKFKVVKSAVFGDRKCVLLLDFMEKSTTINAASYCAILECMRVAIKLQRPGLFTKDALILHDKTGPHVATAKQLFQRFKWTILEHEPYSPDVVPSDFQLFPTFKDQLSGHKFAN